MKHSWKRIFALILAVVMTLSLLPTAALAAKSKSAGRAGGVTIDVTDYGADPTGAKESSTAIREALKYAATLDDDVEKTIVFPKGEYHFYADYSEKRLLYVTNTLEQGEPAKYRTKSIGILVEDMENVTVDGGGSQFIFHGNITTIASIRSQNVVFKNFDMDHASPTVVDVTVESIEGNTATLYIPPCYTYTLSGNTITWKGEPEDGSPYWTGTNNLRYQQGFNTITGQTTRSPGNLPFSNVSSIAQVEGDPTHLKVTYNSADNLPTLGMCFQMRIPNPRMTPGTFFWESDGVEVNHVNIQYLHGFGMVGQLSKNITLDTVKFEARPGTGRTSASFADFVQMSSVGGKVTIRNCEFSNPHDDPINIHGTFLKVTNISSDRRTVTVKYQHNQTWGFPQYYVGDTVDFSSQGSMAPVADSARTVTAVVNPGEGGNDLTTITLTLNEAIPSSITANNYVVENVTYTPDVLIENCRFVETPTRGILVTTRGEVVIQDNYFDRMGMAAIYISCDAQGWWESGRTENVTIRRNTFVVDPATEPQAAIFVDPTGLGSAGNRIHKNMVIENNVFNMDNSGGRNVNAVNARGVDGLTIRNNTIQRYTPNVAMTLSAESQSVNVGASQATSITSNGSTYTAQVFSLEQCEHITIENNTYDDGLNLGVALSGTAANNVTVTGDDLTVGGSNQLPAVGAARYYSSDPAVATVDESGVVTGVSAGTAEIYAYRVAGARTFESNHLTFTVTGTAAEKPNKIDITSDKDAVDVNGTATLTATVDPVGAGSVTWAVKPATEGGAAAITQAGALTATAPGVVEVTASLGGVTASKLITVNKPKELSSAWTVEEEVSGTWSLNEAAETVTINVQSGGDWVTGAGGHNYFLTTAPTGDFEAVVKLDSKTCGTGNCWCETGLVLYKDHDNYVSVVRKNNAGDPKLAVNSESGGSATEGTLVNDTADTTIYLKLTKSGTSYSGYYSSNGTDWTLIRTVDNSISNYRVGFMGINAGNSHGSASSTLGGFTLNGAPVSLVSDNAAPTISDIAVTANGTEGTVTVDYTYSDADSDEETGSVVAWYISDAPDRHYTRLENASAKTLTATAATKGKYVKAVVAPRDATGGCGAPVTSNAVQVPNPTSGGDDATLATLSVSGLPLSPAFDPEVTEYTVDLPASATKVTVAAIPTQGDDAAVTGAGVVDLTGTETTATITVTAPDHTTTKTYTVTINRAASSVATLSSLAASAGSASITYNANTRFYELVAAQDAQTLTFSATPSDASAKIEVRYNAEEQGEYEGQMTLPLMAGMNNLELRVTAADGISTALYRVRVMRPASSEAELTALTVNGGSVTVGDDADLGLVPVTGSAATLNATVSGGATLYLGVDGKTVENGASATLTKTLSMVTIRVVAEDGVTENVYTLALSKPDPDNAQLYSLKLGKLALFPAFDPEVTEYTATDYGFAKAALTAVAAQAGATVTYETVAEYETDTGRIAGDCRFFKDEGLVNQVTVTVTSPNGENTKTYTVTVDVVESAYLSDLPWTSATSGWEEVRRDYDVDPNTNYRLSLVESGTTVTYDKGLGTHANSVIAYDLSDWGFTQMTSKVGMDHSQASANTTQRLRFYVDVDGTNEYTSGELGSATNCEAVSVNVTDKKQLTLRVIYTTANDGNAHADWADAKLSGNIPLLKTTADVPVKYIEFEHEAHTIYVNGKDDAHPGSVELHPTFKPSGVTNSAHEMVLDWDSTNDSVATVNGGVVTAVAVGEVEISATALSGATDTCAITVKKLVEGELSVRGDLRYGTELTVLDNALDQDVRGNVTYTWYRGSEASGAALGTGKTYTPVKDDIGQVLTVKAAAAEDSYYDGEVAFTTDEIGLEAGHEVNEANLTYVNCTTETSADGAIQGLLEGHVYQYQKQNNDGSWPDEADETTWTDVPADSAAITGLAPGNYRIRHAGDDTREPGTPSNTITISVVGTTEVALTVPQRFEGGVVRANRAQIPVGDTVTLTVTPDKGYELDTLEAKYTDENGKEQTLTPTEGSDGKYTFVMPAFPVTIDATFTKSTYHIGHGLEHISCNQEEHQHTATHGETFSIILTPEEGYNMPRSLTVTETGTTTKFTDFTYDAHETDPAKRVLTFPHGVTCDITVEGEATLKTYTVVYELTNGLTAPGAPQTATHSKTLSATLTAARGYTLPEAVTVTVAGAELTVDEDYTYDAGTGEVTIENVTGNVVITAQGEAEDVALQTVTLVGPARVGRTLTVNVEPALATVDYQWILVEEDGTETDIDGATQASYVILETDMGKTIKARVTGTGSYGGELTTAPTDTILAADQPFVFVTGIELSAQEAEVAVGKKVALTATVTPDDATAPALAWSSDNEAIATVDQKGVVTGVAEGTATITASSTDTVDSVKATCQVTVTPAATPDKPSTTRPSTPATTTKTENREDGATVTTVTKPDGSVTETVAQPDGTTSETVVTPEGDTTITVTDPDGEELVKTEIPATIPEPETKFVDIDHISWAVDAINNMAALNLVNGVGGNKYSPTASMTRGQIATVLHRLSNGKTDYKVAFKDVENDKYYAEGVAWAAKANVVKGVSQDRFAPDRIITREQMATMLCRYAKLIGMSTKADTTRLQNFSDGDNTSTWAVDSVAWCVEHGILKGKGANNLDPNADVTRAEVAVMLDRFIALIQK